MPNIKTMYINLTDDLNAPAQGVVLLGDDLSTKFRITRPAPGMPASVEFREAIFDSPDTEERAVAVIMADYGYLKRKFVRLFRNDLIASPDQFGMCVPRLLVQGRTKPSSEPEDNF